MCPLQPEMIIFSIDDVLSGLFRYRQADSEHGRLELFNVGGSHRGHRQAENADAHTGKVHSGLDGDGVRFDKQLVEEI